MDKNLEVKQTIRQIINESLEEPRTTFDGASYFGIRNYVTGLLAEGQKNPQLMSYLTNYEYRLRKGGKEFLMFEEFGTGLAQFAKGNKSVKAVLEQMRKINTDHNDILEGLKIIENIPDDYVRENVLECFNEYMGEPCEETKINLLEAIENVYGLNESAAMNLTLIVTDSSNKQPEMFYDNTINESKQAEINRRVNESRKEKMANDIFKKVERYLDEREKNASEEQSRINEKYSLDGIANKNGLNLYEHIKTVLKSDAVKNVALKNTLLQYSEALSNGAYEERLYETLLQNTAKYDYLLPVDKMRKSILEKAEEKYEQITLTKLLEMMRDNYSSYIFVDLIQEDVARYVENPSPTNRIQLRNALMPYANDPYISEMFRIIYTDDSLSANTLSEKAISIKEQIDLIKQDTTVSNIYTPVQYIRENESIFNVRGQYYVKKGNSIAALDKKYISKLDERFVELCRLVNDPRVSIFEDRIILSGSEQTATIYEGYVEINGYHESAESLRRLNEMCMKYSNYDTNFYIMCSCLLENFDNIARIDWAKHVSLNGNPNLSADLFKLDENIYMALHDANIQKHTFYRNVNPIFCKNALNEHMGINVSTLFADMLPDQDKIILEMNETKTEYENSIDEYEKMIEELNDALEDAQTEDLKKQIKETIDETQKKLDDVKAEYKDWQKETDEMMTDTDEADDGNDQTVTKEVSSEPLDDKEVDDMKQELSTPLTGNAESTDEGEAEVAAIADEIDNQDGEISDDEFSEYLATDASDETENPDDGEFIDTDVVDNTVVEPEDEFEFPDEVEVDEPEDKEEFGVIDTDTEDEEDEGTEGDDEDIFDVENDEIPEEEPEAENVSDEEDILIDEPEVPEDGDMTTIDAESGEEIGDEATDLFGGDTEEPLKDLEVSDGVSGAENEDFNIVSVMFDENVRDNTISKSGEVVVMNPMVDSTGRRYIDEIKIKFYLNADNTPVISASSDISNAIYNGVYNAIVNDPKYTDACERGIDVTNDVVGDVPETTTVADTDDWEKEYIDNASDEDKGIFTVGDDTIEIPGSENLGIDVPEVIDTDAVDADEFNLDFADELPDETPVDVETEVTEEPSDDSFDFNDMFGDFDMTDDEPEADKPVVADPVDTYTDIDGTEIEVPAPEVPETEEKDEEDPAAALADDVIPENFSRKVTKKQMNENRKAILSVKKK